MEGTFKHNIISPSGKYEISFGETHEYGMGGPYASDIYLSTNGTKPILISNMCYADVYFPDDESAFYFMFLNPKRKLQVMQFEIEDNTLKLFKDIFDYAEFETTNTKYGYSVNGKNWFEPENKYNEGLIICDTNEENIEWKKIINE